MKPRGSHALILLLAASCAPPATPPAPPPARIAPPPLPAASSSAGAAPVPAVDTALVSVGVVRPPTLVLDGDLAEWGSPLPVSVPPRHEADSAQPGPPQERPLPSGPNPASASSHLVLALGNDAVTIAAELGEPAKDGVWLGIGDVPPEVPSIGLVARAGYIVPFDCEFEQIRLMEGQWQKGPAKPPEVVAACRALLSRQAELVARHRARFSRLFKIDRDGVHGASADGTLTAIEGAKAVFKAGPHGATAEVSLPLSAMPRLAQAPLTTLRLVARAVTGPKPDVAPARWVEVELPAPLTFEPFGDVRNHALHRLEHARRPTGFSYQPGDPLHVETMSYDAPETSSVVVRETPLQEKPLARLGDVEIAYLTAYRPWLAVYKHGKFLGEAAPPVTDENLGAVVDAFSPTEPHGAVKRDGELHVFSYGPMSIDYYSGMIRWPSWSVIAIAADGTVRDPVEATEVPMMMGSETTGFIGPDHASFGIRGPTDSLHPPRGKQVMELLEVTWRWDPVKKKYVAKQRRSPLPAAPKPPGAVKAKGVK